VLETDRLVLCWLERSDASFVLALVNDPSWLRYIGDKGVKSVGDAERYIENGPAAMFSRFGHGLNRVELKSDGRPIGICGLIKRETMDDVDLGFALLPEFRGAGYAYEAAAATVAHGRSVLGFSRIVAIVSPDNEASCRLLERLGFRLERMVQLGVDREELKLYAV